MSVSYLLWRDIFKKCCHAKAFKIQNDPTRSASLINLFGLGRVVHFGTPDWIRTSGLQSRSYQAVKPESLAVQRFDWYRTNFRHFEEKPQKPCRARLLRFFAIVLQYGVDRFRLAAGSLYDCVIGEKLVIPHAPVPPFPRKAAVWLFGYGSPLHCGCVRTVCRFHAAAYA